MVCNLANNTVGYCVRIQGFIRIKYVETNKLHIVNIKMIYLLYGLFFAYFFDNTCQIFIFLQHPNEPVLKAIIMT